METWLKTLEGLYAKRGRDEDYKREREQLRSYISALVRDLELNRAGIYTLVEPKSVGGTGVVFKAKHSHLPGKDFVVKFSRPMLSPEDQAVVQNECKVLPLFDHAHIIRAIDIGTVEVKETKTTLSFMVEPFVADAKPLGQYEKVPGTDPPRVEYEGYMTELVRKLCPPNKPANPASLHAVLKELTGLLHQWVSALGYIHKLNHVYLDVKPENAVVDKDGYLQVIDLGSVQKLNPEDPNTIYVFYSKKYSDPELDTYEIEAATRNRVKGEPKRSDLKVQFDYHALGVSILELLSEIAKTHPNDFPQIPLFRSLHFLATRLLNGKNGLKALSYQQGYRANEFFGGLKRKDYETITYLDLKSVLIDLEKEEGTWNPESIVPELATYSKESIRVVSGINTTRTQRFETLIRHPLFARLKCVTQLGLLSMVYPTADHSRYDHALGTYTITSAYVKGLFNDTQNPIFRNLINEHDIKAVLLASLLHDLGQYPLAHDLEEVQPRIFDHTRFSIDLLELGPGSNDIPSLKDIVTKENEANCWGVKLEVIEKILRARLAVQEQDWFARADITDFKVNMLSALIDGPIDADKADYIRRDSEACRIPYGQQLDIERLLRVLTIIVYREARSSLSSKATVGVYEKGNASAESFSLARYILFASVYWHHTSRILKAMLQYATAMALPPSALYKSGYEDEVKKIREELVDFVCKLEPPFDLMDRRRTLKSVLATARLGTTRTAPPKRKAVEEILGSGADHKPEETLWKPSGWTAGISYSDWLMLGWIGNLSGATPERKARAQSLLDCIASRSLYKRIYALQRGREDDSLIKTISDLGWQEKIQFCEKLQAFIAGALDSAQPRASGEYGVSKGRKAFITNLAILVDVPDPEKKKGFKLPLRYLAEMKEKTYFEEGEEPIEAKSLSESVGKLMASISPVRILCHPDVQIPIMDYVSSEMLKRMIEDALPPGI
jgi:HD superfamily phosphohydrolase